MIIKLNINNVLKHGDSLSEKKKVFFICLSIFWTVQHFSPFFLHKHTRKNIMSSKKSSKSSLNSLSKRDDKNAVEKVIQKELGSATGTLSNFVIDKKIGQGQFSTVYRAKTVAEGNIVALKRIPASLFFKNKKKYFFFVFF
jgi:hypothetical protein